jgi:hypothetical protein
MAEGGKYSVESISSKSVVRLWLKAMFGLFVAFEFFWIFNSPFLALMAAAFLFFIPSYREGDMANMVYFLIMMLVILYLAFNMGGTSGLGLDLGGSLLEPWEWNSSAIIFMAIWVISFISAIGSSVEDRQGIGVIMILIAFVIFASGPGTQEVGSAFFGQWWPMVHEFGFETLGPIGEALDQLTGTLKSGWELLTCPVCFAQNMMNGTYSIDPYSGLAGAYGVEVGSFRTTPMYVNSPFDVIVKLENKGAYKAEGVEITLASGEDAPQRAFMIRAEIEEKMSEIQTNLESKANQIETEYVQYLKDQSDILLDKASQQLDVILNADLELDPATKQNVRNIVTDIKTRISSLKTTIGGIVPQGSSVPAVSASIRQQVKDAEDYINQKLDELQAQVSDKIGPIDTPWFILKESLNLELEVIKFIWNLDDRINSGIDKVKDGVTYTSNKISGATSAAGTAYANLKTDLQNKWTTVKNTAFDYGNQLCFSMLKCCKESSGHSLHTESGCTAVGGTIVEDSFCSSIAYNPTTDSCKDFKDAVDAYTANMRTYWNTNTLETMTIDLIDKIGEGGVAMFDELEDAYDSIEPYLEDIANPVSMQLDALGFRPGEINEIGDMERLDIRQVYFSSEGVDCDTVELYELREKFIPIDLTLSYKYKIDSQFDMEFISRAEWERLSRQGDLETRVKKAATFKNSPVQLNIDTLEQPILEETPIALSLALVPAQKESSIISPKIDLFLPGEFKITEVTCTPNFDDSIAENSGMKLSWKTPPTVIVCHLPGISVGDIPRKTISVSSHANFSFVKTVTKPFRLEFGGACDPGTGTSSGILEQLKDYCTDRMTPFNTAGGYKCLLGMGGCSKHEDCTPYGTPLRDPSIWLDATKSDNVQKNLECVDITARGIKACCYEGAKPEQCAAAFEEWLLQVYQARSTLLSVPYPYPDQKSIHAAYGAAGTTTP